MMMSNWALMRSAQKDGEVRNARLRADTRRRVLSYGKPFLPLIWLLVGLITIEALIMISVPLLLKRIIDAGIVPQNYSVIGYAAGLTAFLALANAGISVWQRFVAAKIGEGLILRLRTDVFAHVLQQPIAFFMRSETGALVSRLGSDVIGAQRAFTATLTSLTSAVIVLTATLITMGTLSWQLTLACLLLVPLFLFPTKIMGRRLAERTAAQMASNAALSTRMTERFNVSGALLVKIFGSPEQETAAYRADAERSRDTGISIATNRSAFLVALSTAAALATAMVYGVGGWLTASGALSLGSLLALTVLLTRLYAPLTALSNARVEVMTAMVSFERLFEVLDISPLIAEAKNPLAIPAGQVNIVFTDVAFTYPEDNTFVPDSLAPVISNNSGPVPPRERSWSIADLNLQIPAGSTLALVGPSGAGKTTITGLVQRLYDPTSGKITIGGVDLRLASHQSLRKCVGMVTQDAHMFHDTVRNNLLYAQPKASFRQLEKAASQAQILDVINALPQGWDTVVGERGHRLSGGEKQRLAIARLLLKNPQVVLLDEATAHLDTASERLVQKAIEQATHNRSTIVIAHRLSTIVNADAIAVIDNGRIVEYGRHEELIANSGLYAQLSAQQLTR